MARATGSKTSFNVRVEGMSNLQRIPDRIDKAQHVFLSNAGKRFVGALVAATPKRTGRLARSWRYLPVGTKGLILVNDQPYAKAADRGAFIRAKRGKFLRFTVRGREVFVRAVRLPKHDIGKKGLRGRGRIMNEEFRKAFARVGGEVR
jgi:hypothetical protein